jgi:hypothetical protein
MNRFPTSRSGPSRARTVSDEMSALSDVVRGHIASYLPPSDILAIGPVNSQPALSMQRTSALRASAALAVNTRGEFMGLLGPGGTQFNDGSNSIRSLPPSVRAVPLSALASRVSTLPVEDRQDTTVQLLAALDEIPVGDRTTTFNAQRSAAVMIDTALTVNTRGEFMQLLGPVGTQVADVPNSIRSLPPSVRAAPLSALALRVNSLPEEGDRQAVTTDFLAAYNETPAGDRSTPLNAMARAAQDSSDDITPMISVRRGVNVQYAALFNGITDVAEISRLGIEAAMSRLPGSAGAAVRDGGNVLTVARQYGVFSNMAVRALEFHAANSTHERSARAAAANGANEQQIIQQFGLTAYGIGLLANPPIPGV